MSKAGLAGNNPIEISLSGVVGRTTAKPPQPSHILSIIWDILKSLDARYFLSPGTKQ